MFKIGDRVLTEDFGEGVVVSEYLYQGIFVLIKRDDGAGWVGSENSTMPPGRQDLFGVTGLWWVGVATTRLIQSASDYEIDA